jgi:hypothetical protein
MIMKPIAVLALLVFIALPLAAQSDLNPTPNPMNFYTYPGGYDLKTLSLTNAGTITHHYSILTNPESLLNEQVGFYPFDNFYEDLLTNTTGTVEGTSFANDRLAQELHALSFPGSGAHFATRNFALENTFSISFWAKPTANQTMRAEGYYNTALYTNYLLYPDWGGLAYLGRGGLGVALGKNGIMVIEHADSYMPVLINYTADLTGWKHYMVVFSGHVPKLYINGILVRTGLASTKPTTYLSNSFGSGGYGSSIYGSYKGYLDDLCVFDAALTDSQALLSYQFTDMQRFRIQDRFGEIGPSEVLPLMIRMVDNTLPVSAYTDVITVCQMGTTPMFTQVIADISVGGTSFLGAHDLSITLDGTGNALLHWEPGTGDITSYLIFTGCDPTHPEWYEYLGSTTSTSFTVSGGGDPYYLNRRYFSVVSYIDESGPY